MLIDQTKDASGVLSRCKVCGRYFPWESNDNKRFYDVSRGKWRYLDEPEHCGSTVCQDFMQYYEEHKHKMFYDFEYAQHAYLKKKGML